MERGSLEWLVVYDSKVQVLVVRVGVRYRISFLSLLPPKSCPSSSLESESKSKSIVDQTTFGAKLTAIPRKNHSSAPILTSPKKKEPTNLAPTPRSQLCGNNSSNPIPNHLLLTINQHSSIIVEPNISPIWSSGRIFRSDYDGSTDVSAADFRGGGGAC